MRYILLILSILTFSSCREEVNGWDSLTAAEQAEIRARAQSKCLSSNAASYNTFKDVSAEAFTSTAYARGKGFLIEFKENATVKQSVEFTVWGQDSDRLYFYVTETNGLGVSSSFFLRAKETQMEEMIDDFKADHCDNSATKYLVSASTDSNGLLTMVLEYNRPNGATTQYFTDTYTFLYSRPAFMGSYMLGRKLVTKDSDGVQTSSVTFTSTLTNKNTVLPSTDHTNAAYTQKFCEIDAMAPFRLSKDGSIGFAMVDPCPVVMPTVPADEWEL